MHPAPSRNRSQLLSALRIPCLLTGLALALAATPPASAQALPTATQASSLSVFGGLTGTYTGLSGYGGGNGTPWGYPVGITAGNATSATSYQGKNLGITAGVNFRFGDFRGFLPSVEVRGTYPIHTGQVDAQENILGGLKVEHSVRSPRLHVYGDILFGRGKVTYENGGYFTPDGSLLYAYSVSNVYAPGGGVEYDLTPRFAVKLDGQFEHYSVPVTTSHTIYAKALTAGVIYRFNFNHRPKQLPDK
jgi:hypothetical protein